MSVIEWLWEAVTRTPYHTGRCASLEFGPPPGAVYAAELSRYSDAELVALPRGELLADARRGRVSSRRQLSSVR